MNSVLCNLNNILVIFNFMKDAAIGTANIFHQPQLTSERVVGEACVPITCQMESSYEKVDTPRLEFLSFEIHGRIIAQRRM